MRLDSLLRPEELIQKGKWVGPERTQVVKPGQFQVVVRPGDYGTITEVEHKPEGCAPTMKRYIFKKDGTNVTVVGGHADVEPQSLMHNYYVTYNHRLLTLICEPGIVWEDAPGADQIRDYMDGVWKTLTAEEQAYFHTLVTPDQQCRAYGGHFMAEGENPESYPCVWCEMNITPWVGWEPV